jgi:hypothetical protein
VLGRGFAVILVVLVLGLLAGGCGSGDSANTGSEGETAGGEIAFTGKPTKKPKFIKDGDAVCSKVPLAYRSNLQKYTKQFKNLPKKKKEEEETLKAAIPPLRIAAKEFQELGPPKADEAKAIAMVEALESAADELEKEPNAPLSGPGSPFEEFSKLTKNYGFSTCPQL